MRVDPRYQLVINHKLCLARSARDPHLWPIWGSRAHCPTAWGIQPPKWVGDSCESTFGKTWTCFELFLWSKTSQKTLIVTVKGPFMSVIFSYANQRRKPLMAICGRKIRIQSIPKPLCSQLPCWVRFRKGTTLLHYPQVVLEFPNTYLEDYRLHSFHGPRPGCLKFLMMMMTMTTTTTTATTTTTTTMTMTMMMTMTTAILMFTTILDDPLANSWVFRAWPASHLSRAAVGSLETFRNRPTWDQLALVNVLQSGAPLVSKLCL